MSTGATTNDKLETTAHWAAAVRARERLRADRLFDDPWAGLLAGEAGEAWITARSEDAVVPMVLRTRFFDDFLLRAARDGGIRQVTIMAAGLDTRAYRLAWPEQTRLYELDWATVLKYKEETLLAQRAVPACQLERIAVDLTGPWEQALTKAGFDPGEPSIWLLEGFLFYLPNSDIERILDGVTRLSAPGSWLGFDIVNTATLTSTWTRTWIEMQAKSGAPWLGTMDDPVGFLAERSWEATLTQPGEEGVNFGRWRLPVVPGAAPDMPHDWFVTARKKE